MVFIDGMTIWILAVVLLASGFGLGFRQGAIRVAFAFLGIVAATLFAGLAGKIFKAILPHLGFQNPAAIWCLAPILGFVLVWILFKMAGFEVHRRVNVYYKYKAGDLQLGLWERLNSHVGACLGLLNGIAWLALISFLIFNFSYWTAQVAPSEQESRTTRIINTMGHDLESTGLDKVGRAVGSVPNIFYRMANFAGLIFQNRPVVGRLANYPAFISLSERSDVQQLGSVSEEWRDGAPVSQIEDNSQVHSLLQNTNLTIAVWDSVNTNMADITNYLITGKSPKFDSEKLVGRWNFDLIPALADLRQEQPKIKPTEMKAIRELWSQAFAQAAFVAGTDGQAFLENIPDFKQKPPAPQTWTGQWSDNGAGYDLSLSANGRTQAATAQTDGLRLTIKMDNATYVFDRAAY